MNQQAKLEEFNKARAQKSRMVLDEVEIKEEAKSCTLRPPH